MLRVQTDLIRSGHFESSWPHFCTFCVFIFASGWLNFRKHFCLKIFHENNYWEGLNRAGQVTWWECNGISEFGFWFVSLVSQSLNTCGFSERKKRKRKWTGKRRTIRCRSCWDPSGETRERENWSTCSPSTWTSLVDARAEIMPDTL